MRTIYILILLLLTCNGYSQTYQDSFNDTAWWQRLKYEEQTSITNFSFADTTIVVATNRFHTRDPLRFMSEERGNGELLYYFVYAHEGQWHILKVKDLETAVSLMPDKTRSWVVYTEGMGKIFTSELNRGMMMSSQYDVNVLMLDYPSITTTKKIFGNYFFSLINARNNYKDYAPVLEKIKRLKLSGEMGSGNLTLFFHSMGNYLARQTVKKKKLAPINDTVWTSNIILNAACVPQHGHAKWMNKIKFADDIYVNYNPEDMTLKWPEIINKKRQLGRRIGKSTHYKVHYVNFNNLVGDGHSYFLTLQGRQPVNKTVWEYYNVTLHGNNVKLEAPRYTKSSYKGIGYDILPN